MINFLKYRLLYLGISLAVLVPGVYSLLRWGFRPSIDFVGGTVIEISDFRFQISDLENALEEENIEIESIHQDNDIVTIRTKPIEREQWEQVKVEIVSRSAIVETDLEQVEIVETGLDPSAIVETGLKPVSTPSATLTELRFESVGPVLGRELLQKTLIAAGLAVIGILLYVAWAFRDIVYGISAIIALFHDVLVVTGIFSLLGHFMNVEIDLLFVTALLTTMSFSVHDTIVVFDRIRESIRREKLPFNILVNKALTETMTRSVNNSLTILFMLLALILLGGDTIRWFIVALVIGTVSGTYSSPFVAAPILCFLKRRMRKA